MPAGFDRRGESEGGQAIYRVQAALAGWVGALCLVQLGVPDAVNVCVRILAYVLFSMVWILVIARNMGSARTRQYIALVLDQLLLNSILLSGVAFGVLFWAGPMASIGHGLRFGLRRGMVSAAIGSVLAAAACAATPEWQALPLVSLGIVLTALFLPLYAVRLARHMALANAQARAHASAMETLAHHDALTGLRNRFGLEAAMSALPAPPAASGDSHAALAYLDLDGFKAVNDELGHHVGDRVLQAVADRLRRAVRDGDTVARLGGDEFAILLTSRTTLPDLEAFGARLQDCVGAIVPEGRDDLAVMASTGIWRFPTGTALEQVLRDADALMYRSKQAGPGRFALGG